MYARATARASASVRFLLSTSQLTAVHKYVSIAHQKVTCPKQQFLQRSRNEESDRSNDIRSHCIFELGNYVRPELGPTCISEYCLGGGAKSCRSGPSHDYRGKGYATGEPS